MDNGESRLWELGASTRMSPRPVVPAPEARPADAGGRQQQVDTYCLAHILKLTEPHGDKPEAVAIVFPGRARSGGRGRSHDGAGSGVVLASEAWAGALSPQSGPGEAGPALAPRAEGTRLGTAHPALPLEAGSRAGGALLR